MRVLNWDVRLVEWADRRVCAPFAWGETDCWLLCLEAIDCLRGSSAAERYRGRWTNEREALAFQRGIDLRAILEAEGCRQVKPGFVQRGDLMLAPSEHFTCGHVCLGALALSVPLHGTVQFIPSRPVIEVAGVVVLRAG